MIDALTLAAEPVALAVALGAGLLIGLERERRKGQGDDRAAAGLRTFMVTALAGAMGQILSFQVAAVVLAAVALLAGLSYWRSRAQDPGLTTEVALLATALIGMLAVPAPALAAGAAVVLAVVLAARDRLHRFATQWLSDAEMHDTLMLAALVLILLPLLPAQPLAWLGGLSPRRMLTLLVVILAMQALSHVAQRLLGGRLGLPVSGLLTVGRTIADAFLHMYLFESTCQIQLAAQSGGAVLTEVNPQIVQGVAHAMKVQTGGMGGAFVWPSLIRKLDRIDTGWRA